MRLKALMDFSYAHDCITITSYKKDQEIDTDDEDFAQTALHEKWCVEAKKTTTPPSVKI